MSTVKLSPVFNDQTFNSSNVLASGYQLFTYAAGSTTKQTAFTDSTGSTPQTNPIILNSQGYPTNGQIWLTAGLNYKFVLASPTDTDPPSSPLKTIDNVAGVNDTAVTVSQWVASSLTPTYISASSFSLAGDQTGEFHIGRRLQLVTSLSGSIYGTILTSVYGSLTTVTMTMDSTTLDATLSSVNLSILRNDKLALPYHGYSKGLKNYIINGGCVVAKRGNVAAVKDVWTYGGSDRICVNIGGTTASGTIQRYASASCPSGYAQGIPVTTTGVGTVYFQQRTESFNALPLNGKNVTISALVYQNTGSSQTANIVIGKPTTTADVFSAQTTLGTSAGFTIPSDTPTRINYSLTLGATDASLGLYAQIGYSSIGAVTAKDFWITDFQLEQGSIATSFEVRPLGLETVLCQRYYQLTPVNVIYWNGYSVAATQNQSASYSFPVTMRAAPIVTAPSWSLTQCSTPVLGAYSEGGISYYGASTLSSATVFFANSTAIKLDAEL